jgi:hypothetical protein
MITVSAPRVLPAFRQMNHRCGYTSNVSYVDHFLQTVVVLYVSFRVVSRSALQNRLILASYRVFFLASLLFKLSCRFSLRLTMPSGSAWLRVLSYRFSIALIAGMVRLWRRLCFLVVCFLRYLDGCSRYCSGQPIAWIQGQVHCDKYITRDRYLMRE